MKTWFRSKTVWINALVIALAYWADGADVYINPLWFVWLIAFANIALRFATRGPITVKGGRS